MDYKTGNKQAKAIKEVADVFNPAKINDFHIDYQLQVMLYSLLIARHSPELNPLHKPVSPALLFIQHTASDDYSPVLSIGDKRIADIESLQEEFDQHLRGLLGEIFDPATPFSPNTDENACTFCPYKALCGKSSDVGIF